MTYDHVGSLCQIDCAGMFTGWPGILIGVDLIMHLSIHADCAGCFAQILLVICLAEPHMASRV